MKGILRSVKKRDFITYVIYLIESSISKVMADPKKYKPTPDAIVQTTVIFDMEGMSIQHVTNRKGNVAYYVSRIMTIDAHFSYSSKTNGIMRIFLKI